MSAFKEPDAEVGKGQVFAFDLVGSRLLCRRFRLMRVDGAVEVTERGIQSLEVFSPRGGLKKLLQGRRLRLFVLLTRRREEGRSIEDRRKGASFRYKPSETIPYLRYTESKPDLHLACVYLSVALQAYANDMASYAKPELRNDIAAFGKQFNASNLVTTLLAALCRSLLKLRGSHATTENVDEKVIEDALRFLHETRQFEIRDKGFADSAARGKELVLQCPMERYLFDLLIKHNALTPVLRATTKIDRQCREHPKNKNPQTAMEVVQEVHRNNAYFVSLVAGVSLGR